MGDDRASLYFQALREVVAALSSGLEDAAQIALEVAADAIADEDEPQCTSLDHTNERQLTLF